ncbi:hypothetical protein DSM106972_066710 [Dulcicalothrix desertica PCC 7102]|uniref:DUF2808 domain-containing protein n=1 Tax=Dulcicalothrix desertica PCC 7102 TaxID=232991 RepID=A0A3S1AIV1_9CYAN|nr:DUF2808 domain-containing protein [Dulcicalothrix desertica]RUT01574.1 hypothetical protein DSM106972_066710 [Dulcicalothrix desertica PCC 7102]
MNKLIYATAFTLVIASTVPSAWAKSPNDANITHLGKSAAVPLDALVPDATHKFDVHVQGKALSELTIDIPEDVSFKGITVKNKSGQKIPATVSVNDKKATVAFSEPVAPGNSLTIFMNGVNATNTYDYSRTLHYRVSTKMVGMNGDIPLGLARVQTYRD